MTGDDLRYLELATSLLQRMRRARAEGGIWEAADVQWWHREERPTDRVGQLFWLDHAGQALAASMATDFGHSVQCDVFVLAADPGFQRDVWRAAIGRADDTGVRAEFVVRADDPVGIAELTAAGYGPADQAAVVPCWLAAARRPPVPPLPPGYRVRRLKVCNDRDLYQRAGFRPLSAAVAAIYTLSGTTEHV